MENNWNDNDNETSESDDDIGHFIFEGIDENTLRIETVTLDDLFTGASSKQRWWRAPNQENIRFLPQQELFIYINYHLLPHLRRVFSTGQNLFIWIAALVSN